MSALLQDYISKNAQLRPDNVVIQDGHKTITYAEMDAFTNKFARFLLSLGVCRQDCIGLLMPKSINAFKGLVAILKADASYVPLNIQAPANRNSYILDQSKCRFLICDNSSQAQALAIVEEIGGANIKIVTIDENVAASESTEPLVYQNTPSDLAYVLFTSGSTGVPKGVMITHGNVINYAEWTVNYLGITPDDRLSSHPGLFFDLSVFDVYSAFKSGASLHLVPQASSMFPIKIVDFIEQSRLTIWNSVPSLYTFMARARVLNPSRLSSLRALTFNGEVMPTSTVMDWMKACPQARFVNQYGPTETTCASLFYEITEIPDDASVPIPIGKAISNTKVFALTDEGDNSGVNELGELHIMGAGVGRGYLFDEEKTRKVFVTNPLGGQGRGTVYATGDLVRLRSDGNYDFLNRKDHQIKYMGYRIELGEIEATLNSFDYVTSSSVLGIEHEGSGGLMIVAFVVFKVRVDDAQVKAGLEKIIPHYMVPKVIVGVNQLPLNHNGKTDRVKLKEIYLAGH
ncbi:MAG: amino acid adenylation domain-containing protein [Proteobacteria bacterium]|nr:amino acid adenylation domain-containing protein [Pseudomonadota bacterium]